MKLVMIALLFFASFAHAAFTGPVSTNLKPPIGVATLASWSAGATGDVGAPISLPSYEKKSVQVSGTFGGATVTLEGSNDGTTYAALLDQAGASVAFTAAGLKQIVTNARYIRPNITGGAGSALVTTVLFSR